MTTRRPRAGSLALGAATGVAISAGAVATLGPVQFARMMTLFRREAAVIAPGDRVHVAIPDTATSGGRVVGLVRMADGSITLRLDAADSYEVRTP